MIVDRLLTVAMVGLCVAMVAWTASVGAWPWTAAWVPRG